MMGCGTVPPSGRTFVSRETDILGARGFFSERLCHNKKRKPFEWELQGSKQDVPFVTDLRLLLSNVVVKLTSTARIKTIELRSH